MCLPQGTGEDEDDVESSSSTLVQTEDGYQAVFFDPRPLKNLLLIDEVTSLMPITDLKVSCVWSWHSVATLGDACLLHAKAS